MADASTDTAAPADQLPTAEDFFGAKSPYASGVDDKPTGGANQLPTADEFFAAPEATPSVGGISAFSPTSGEKPMPLNFKGQDWRDYLNQSVTGRVMLAFEDAATDPEFGDEEKNALRKAGIFNEVNDGQQQIKDGYGQGVTRPWVNRLRGLAEVASGPVEVMARTGAGVVAAVGQAFTEPLEAIAEAGENAEKPGGLFTPVARAVHLQALTRDVAAGLELAMTRGEIAPHLPAPVARARLSGTIGEGEEGYFGTSQGTQGTVDGRIKAAGDIPQESQHEQIGTENKQIAELNGEGVSRETVPPDVHAVARQLEPEVFKEYDTLAPRRDTFARWLGELQEPTAANIEAKPPEALQDLDRQIADVEKKAANAGARMQDRYADQLDDLHGQRADLMADLVRNDPGVARVRADLQAADYRMRALAPQVSDAYRRAAAEGGETVPEGGGAPEPAAGVAEAEGPSVEATPAVVKGSEVSAETVAEPENKGEAPATREYPAVTAIANDVAGKLVAAGRPEEEANAAAQIVNSYYETRAERFEGKLGTAQEMYDREAPAVRRQGEKARVREMAQTKGVVGRVLEQAKRGAIRILDDGTKVIRLLKNADASTFMHEIGHAWLEDLMADAAREEAPLDLKADADTVRKWLGTKEGETIPGKKHEKWARGFERYLMEGRAPSKELANVFAKFKEWLTKIYRAATSLKSPINDDIRDVFDRLLSRNPEHTTITPEERPNPSLADIHEADAETTQPHEAATVADRVHTEAANEVRSKTPEAVNDAKLEPGTEVGTGASQRPGIPGEGNAAGPQAGEAGAIPEPGAQFPSRSETPPKSAVPRGPVHVKTPREPLSLSAFLKKQGGLKDEGGEMSSRFATSKAARGLRNERSGISFDTAAERAQEHGYFPELGGANPDHAQLLEKLDTDLRGEKQYSDHDTDAAQAYRDAVDHNSEVDRLATSLAIETKGLSYEDFWNTVAERMSSEEAAKYVESKDIEALSALAEADRQAQHWLDSRGESWEADISSDQPEARSLEDLERERQSEETARRERQGQTGVGGPEHATGDQGPVQEGAGQRGREPEPSGRAGEEGGSEESGRGRESGAGPGADERPHGEPTGPAGITEPDTTGLGKAGFNPDAPFAKDKDGKDLAGNIRLENLRTSEDVDAMLRSWAAGRDDLMDARHNEESYRGQVEVEATRALFCDVAASTRAAEIKFAQSGAEADAVALMQWRDRLDMIGDRLATLAAYGGRMVRAFRKMDGAKEILERLKGRDLFQLQQQARAASKFESPMQLARWNKLTSLDKMDRFKSMLIELFVNNLISGPVTHMAYLAGNVITAAMKPIFITPVEASIGALREFAAGGPVDRVYFREIPARLAAFGKMADGLPAAWKAAKSGIAPTLPGEVAAELPFDLSARSVHSIPGKIGNVLNAPSHAVTGIHTFSSAFNYEIEKAALITRQAISEGLDGDALTRRIAVLDKDTPMDVMKEASAEARKMVMMDRGKWDSLTADISRFTNKYVLAKIVLPFVQMPARLLHGGLVEMTPVGLLEKQIRENLSGVNGAVARDTQAAKMAAGVGMATGVISLVAQGLMTGSAPVDPHEAMLWQMSGKQPYSFKWNDHWVPYRKWLGFYGPLVSTAANMYQAGHILEEKTMTAAAASLFFGFTEVVADESWMGGFSNLIEAVKHWDTKGEQYIRGLSTSFIPGSVGLSQIAKMVDPYQRHASSITEAAMAKIPWLSRELMPHRDVFGEPMASHTPITVSKVNNDPVIQEMLRMQVWPHEVGKTIRGVKLTEQQYDDYARIAGKNAKQQLDNLVLRPNWQQIPGHLRRQIMQKTVTGAREQARQTVMQMYAHTPNDIMAQAHATKEAEKADFDDR